MWEWLQKMTSNSLPLSPWVTSIEIQLVRQHHKGIAWSLFISEMIVVGFGLVIRFQMDLMGDRQPSILPRVECEQHGIVVCCKWFKPFVNICQTADWMACNYVLGCLELLGSNHFTLFPGEYLATYMVKNKLDSGSCSPGVFCVISDIRWYVFFFAMCKEVFFLAFSSKFLLVYAANLYIF